MEEPTEDPQTISQLPHLSPARTLLAHLDPYCPLRRKVRSPTPPPVSLVSPTHLHCEQIKTPHRVPLTLH
jgi:hypothetical protein